MSSISERDAERQAAAVWRLSLKYGDQVVVLDRSVPQIVGVVSRVTATQLVISCYGTVRFRRDNGREVGNPYGRTIVPVEDKHLARIQAAKNRSEFATIMIRRDGLSDGEIAVMLDALKAHRASQEGAQ